MPERLLVPEFVPLVRDRQRVVKGWAFEGLSAASALGVRAFLDTGRVSELPERYLPVVRAVLASSGDRPLSDAQERALIALAPSGGRLYRGDVKWRRVTEALPGVQPSTLRRLRDLGLIEVYLGVARITDAGLALLDSMGD